jgi:hypothetical protein
MTGLAEEPDEELQSAVADAERDLAEGCWVEHSEVLAKPQRWSLGEP